MATPPLSTNTGALSSSRIVSSTAATTMNEIHRCRRWWATPVALACSPTQRCRTCTLCGALLRPAGMPVSLSGAAVRPSEALELGLLSLSDRAAPAGGHDRLLDQM